MRLLSARPTYRRGHRRRPHVVGTGLCPVPPQRSPPNVRHNPWGVGGVVVGTHRCYLSSLSCRSRLGSTSPQPPRGCLCVDACYRARRWTSPAHRPRPVPQPPPRSSVYPAHPVAAAGYGATRARNALPTPPACRARASQYGRRSLRFGGRYAPPRLRLRRAPLRAPLGLAAAARSALAPGAAAPGSLAVGGVPCVSSSTAAVVARSVGVGALCPCRLAFRLPLPSRLACCRPALPVPVRRRPCGAHRGRSCCLGCGTWSPGWSWGRASGPYFALQQPSALPGSPMVLALPSMPPWTAANVYPPRPHALTESASSLDRFRPAGGPFRDAFPSKPGPPGGPFP